MSISASVICHSVYGRVIVGIGYSLPLIMRIEELCKFVIQVVPENDWWFNVYEEFMLGNSIRLHP